MPENRSCQPEGLMPLPVYALSELKEALANGTVLEGMVQRCDSALELHLSLGGISARIPRQEVVAPWVSGAQRDIAVLSRVGKLVCFTVDTLTADAKGAPVALLSRRKAQELAWSILSERLIPGSIVTGRVVGLEPFGAFVDIGRGIVALLPTEYISMARIHHPAERFQLGQKILAAVLRIDRDAHRITLTHRELLGTWLENASHFSIGDTVRGIVRSVQDYGCFVELAPGLSGLTDQRTDLSAGDAVSVMVRSIRPERMKIKLQVVEKLTPLAEPLPFTYQITDGILDRWVYSPVNYEKPPIETVFRKVGGS